MDKHYKLPFDVQFHTVFQGWSLWVRPYPPSSLGSFSRQGQEPGQGSVGAGSLTGPGAGGTEWETRRKGQEGLACPVTGAIDGSVHGGEGSHRAIPSQARETVWHVLLKSVFLRRKEFVLLEHTGNNLKQRHGSVHVPGSLWAPTSLTPVSGSSFHSYKSFL